MPVENTPDFLQNNEQAKQPGWIDEVVLEFRKGTEGQLPYEELQRRKLLDLTRTAVGAASSPYISGHVENNTFVNTPPEAATLEPITVEVLNYKQLAEPVFGDRIENIFRQDAVLGRTPRPFAEIESERDAA